jgi:hypothetical protein
MSLRNKQFQTSQENTDGYQSLVISFVMNNSKPLEKIPKDISHR